MTDARQVVTGLIRWVKKDDTYVVDPALGLGAVVIELGRRGGALLRAQWALRFVAGPRLRFAEPNVVIRHRKCLKMGAGTVVEAFARIEALSARGFTIGDNVTVGKYSIIEGTSVLWNVADGFSIGNDSSIGDWSFIGCAGGVDIGSRVLMGQRVSIHSENHVYADPAVPIKEQGVTNDGVVIGDDCWLGSGAVILDGVRLGAGCVVAAGAVVTKSFPENSVIGGVPARQIATRGESGARGPGGPA